MAHVSYSEIKTWNECPHKHRLQYVEKISGFKGNLHTAFGTAIHSVCEHGLLNEDLDREKHFLEEFEKEIVSLEKKEVEIDKTLREQMMGQYAPIVSSFREELDNYFEDCEVISTEEMLYEDIEGHDLKFKGFIDLVVKTKDGKYHILDWKTTSWGWRAEKKSDSITAYQLSLYKNYFANKYNVDHSQIETHFALMKRTAKGKKVEIFRVTNGKKRVANAIDLLSKAINHINSENFVKNRLSCSRCEFHKTKHCT